MALGYFADAFDMINVRDLDLIAQASSQCERLVVGVFTDDYTEQLLGRPPVVPLAERMTLVAHVKGVDDVLVHDAERGRTQLSHPSIRRAEPDTVYFWAADRSDIAVPTPQNTEVLVPQRTTNSAALRAALVAVGGADEAVA